MLYGLKNWIDVSYQQHPLYCKKKRWFSSSEQSKTKEIHTNTHTHIYIIYNTDQLIWHLKTIRDETETRIPSYMSWWISQNDIPIKEKKRNKKQPTDRRDINLNVFKQLHLIYM